MTIRFSKSFEIQPSSSSGGGGGSQPKHVAVLEESTYPVSEKIKVDLLNFSIIGTLAYNSEVLSGFSAENYACSSSAIPALGNNSWELECSLTTGSSLTADQETVELSTKGASPFYFIRNSGFRLYLSSDGANWDISNTGSAYLSAATKTTYRLKCVYDGEKYEVLKYDSGNWNTLTTVNSSTPIHWDGNLWFGVNMRGETPACPFGGSINMNYCRLTSNGNVIWEGITK